MKATVDMALGKVGELGNFIRDQRRNARLSLRKLSNQAGISNPYLSQIERGLRRPSAEILQAIARALRISAETLYVKAGILEERGESLDPVSALLHDHNISDKQKQVLIEVYQSFRHENELGGKGQPADIDRTARKVKVAALKQPAKATARSKRDAAKRKAGRKPPTKQDKKKKAKAATRPAKKRGKKKSR
jgi:transcriptional regulator with XRE-family HTH domain